jgi:hypothetical protein
MHNSLAHKALAIFMALYLPFALVGIPLHKHYCQGNLEDVQVFLEADSCHDEAKEEHACCGNDLPSCHQNQEEDACMHNSCASNECCDDEVELLKAELVLISSSIPDYSTDIEECILVSSSNILIAQKWEISPVYQSQEKPPGPYLNGQSRLVHHGSFLC